jgi:hypothetical protein
MSSSALPVACSLLVLAPIALGIPSTSAASDAEKPLSRGDSLEASYLQTLIEHADDAQLDTDPQWLALLHYEGDLFTWGSHSHAEGSDFFVSPDGARDPRAELHATLAAFFDPHAIAKNSEHPQCAFIARRHWLGDKLEFDTSQISIRECEHYETWRAGLQASGMTLIYPEGFINNPASMFGHTLLRIDTPESKGPAEVLGHAVDFTGNVGQDGGIAYLFKGVFGLYSGHFGVNPYYQQLRRYAELENRDIWEYPLNLSGDELDLLLMHLWELRGVAFPYWFFTKNCSYQLFRLLEVARPALREEDRLRLTVIPLDTVRSAVDHADFTGEPSYRPSPATQLRHDLDLLSREEIVFARSIAEGRLDPMGETVNSLAPPRRAAVLGVAYDELQYAFSVGRTTQEESQGLARRILIARSKLGDLGDALPPLGEVATPAIPPHEAHGSALLELASGVRDGDPYVDFRFRPAFHTLLDREGGYTQNMQIRFLDTRIRYYPDDEDARLQELTLFEAISLSPRAEVFQPFAWRLRSGFDTRRVRRSGGLKDSWVSRTDIGAGLAYRPADAVHLYLMATVLFDAGPRLDHDVSLGFGGIGGAYLRTPLDRLKLHVFVDSTEFVAGDTTTRLRTGSEARISITRNLSIVGSASYNRIAGEGWFEGGLGVGFFF